MPKGSVSHTVVFFHFLLSFILCNHSKAMNEETKQMDHHVKIDYNHPEILEFAAKK